METYFKFKFIMEYIVPFIIFGLVIFVYLLFVLVRALINARQKRIRKMNEKFWKEHGED